MNTEGLMLSIRQDWRTPALIARKATRVLGDIDLDPCGSEEPPQVVQARRVLTPKDDGLTASWGRGTVYMNPPYGREIIDWADRYAREVAYGNVTAGLVLVPARTDTVWWQRLTQFPTTIVMFYGRLHFNDDQRGAATFPSALLLHTPVVDHKYAGVQQRFIAEFNGMGGLYYRIHIEKEEELWKNK